jgi:hypothetical protein
MNAHCCCISVTPLSGSGVNKMREPRLSVLILCALKFFRLIYFMLVTMLPKRGALARMVSAT